MLFGEFVRARRLAQGYSLRQFCEKAHLDPSNWSKVERGLSPAPNRKTLDLLAKILALKKASEESNTFFDLASIARKKIPEDILADKEAMALLPAFIRNAREGKKPKRIMAREPVVPYQHTASMKPSAKVMIVGGENIRFPVDNPPLVRAIEKSKFILALPENWDDEGARPYEEATWLRAVRFLARCDEYLHSKFGLILDAPRITDGPEGSIDIEWRTPVYRLLLNIPERISSPATFYGDDFAESIVRGSFNVSQIRTGILIKFAEVAHVGGGKHS